jgi:hypothetical protein
VEPEVESDNRTEKEAEFVCGEIPSGNQTEVGLKLNNYVHRVNEKLKTKYRLCIEYPKSAWSTFMSSDKRIGSWRKRLRNYSPLDLVFAELSPYITSKKNHTPKIELINNKRRLLDWQDPLFPPDLFTDDQLKSGAVVLHIIGGSCIPILRMFILTA